MPVLTAIRPSAPVPANTDNGAEVLRTYRARLLNEIAEIDRELARLEK